MNKIPQFSNKLQKQTLAEQVAWALEEAILEGEWSAGEALPTEPELADSFEVSRAVIRDATRMLAARGLVQAQHGRGVFVTESQAEAFGSALLLALRRNDASVWDVEQFEQMVFPQVCALAATAASDDDRAAIHQLGRVYIKKFSKMTKAYWRSEDKTPPEEIEVIRAAFIAFLHAIFEATHNKLWQLLAGPILQLRSIRHWDDESIELETLIAIEKRHVDMITDAVLGQDPLKAQEIMSKLMVLPPEAVAAMRETPVGKAPQITVNQNVKG